jgi:DNA-binding LytR/AlgR family response regulator
MELTCVAIDDEPLALELLRQHTSRFPELKLLHCFNDAVEAISYLKNNSVDLLFVDVNMPDVTGIDLVKSLPEKPMIIFTTAYKKFAIDGFELDAIDYLLKPIEFNRFAKAVNKAMDFSHYKNAGKQKEEEHIFVRSEYQLVKINLNEIEYIESMEDYLKIHLSSGKFVMTLMTLKGMLDKLPSDRFQRIHRSYVVALPKVKSVLNKRVRLQSTELPVSDSYSDFIKNWTNK